MAGLDIIPGQSGYMNLTSSERDTIVRVERVGASLSLVGVLFIFVTYGLSKRVRSVPNTFILFASVANVGASIACAIGYAGIEAGDDSALCQTQAFLLEMFMQSDPWWSFAMAINVYMVFFMAYNPNNFHKHLWAYCLVCFGVPAIFAFVCLLYVPNGQRIYGNATLWCWIGDQYNRLRIYTYYMPVWVCIVLSAVIYVAVGYHVFHQRNQLRNLTLSAQAKDCPGTELRGSAENTDPGSYGTVTTKVQVTAERTSDASQITPPSTPSAASIAPVLPRAILPAPSHHPWVFSSPHDDPCGYDAEAGPGPCYSAFGAAGPGLMNANLAAGNAFTTISSISSSRRPKPAAGSSVNWASLRRPFDKFMTKLRNLDPIKLAYLRTSFVFAISVLVIWIPSSINRVYSLIYPHSTSYGLNLASAVVLPLQGLWNMVIFTATSWTPLKEEWAALKDRVRASVSWKRERERESSSNNFRWEVPGPDSTLNDTARTRGGPGGGMMMMMMMKNKSEMEFQFRDRLGSGGSESRVLGGSAAGQGGSPRTVVPNRGGPRGNVRVIKGSSL